MKAEPIQAIEERYKNEWLVIKVVTIDKHFNPVTGELIGHTPNKQEAISMQRGVKEHVMVTFTGPIVPEGKDIILYGNISTSPYLTEGWSS